MKNWKKKFIITTLLTLSVGCIIFFKTENEPILKQSASNAEISPEQMKEHKHIHRKEHDHTHASQRTKLLAEDSAKIKEITLSPSLKKAKHAIQQSLIGDMQVKLNPISLHQWKNRNTIVNAEKVLVEINSPSNKISSSYFAFIDSKTGKIIRTFSTPIFENKDLVGKNIFYIE